MPGDPLFYLVGWTTTLLMGIGKGAFGGGLALSPTGPALAQAVFETNPFRLGVTAGDPLPDGFVIWTRLAPDPLAYGSGMPASAVAVKWEVAADRGFGTVVRSGEAIARP